MADLSEIWAFVAATSSAESANKLIDELAEYCDGLSLSELEPCATICGVNVRIADELSPAIAQLIERGDFNNAQGVVDEAVRRFILDDDDYQSHVRATLLTRLAEPDREGVLGTEDLAERVTREARARRAQRSARG